MKDWLGAELAVGDTVIYPAGSGRSITMVIGEIVGFGERTEPRWNGEDDAVEPTIKVQPLRSSRWQQHYGRDYYVDVRTGKRIDPHRQAKDGTFPHIAEHGHYLDADGERHPRQDYRGNEPLYTYVPTAYRDHVEQRNDGPKPVTIHVTDNVTRWHGQL